MGDAKTRPRVPEVAELLGNPEQNVAINLLGIDVADRPSFLSELIPALSQLRVETARRHWLVIDETHHLLPSTSHGAPLILPREFPANVLVAVDPERVAAEALQAVEYLVALGDEADHVVEAFCQMVGEGARRPSGNRLIAVKRCSGAAAPASFGWYRQFSRARSANVTAANMRRGNLAKIRASTSKDLTEL